ncbi:hypothetical protein BHE74_00034537 [Ensete ventricosum]|nr:hypothetical protein BHE74_00034537 [Ensete ventricosum]
MSQERPLGNSSAEHRPEPNHSQPTEEVTAAAPTPNRFWRMMTDPGFPSPASNPAPFVVTAKAFLGLTSQVQALVGMVQTIVPYLSQLIHSATHQSAPPTTFLQTESLVAPNRETPLEAEPPQRQVTEAHAASPTPAPARSQSDSPFTPEIQGKPLLANFRLPTFEPYDGSGDPTKHIATFYRQMALYDTSDALMCRAFSTILRGPARTWYSRLKLASISSFDMLAKEFELNFLASARPKPTIASLLGLVQGSDEPLSQFVRRFTSQVQEILYLHPSLTIQAFLTGLRSSRFFWSLIERPPATLLEMLQWTHQYMAVETLVAGKRDETKRPGWSSPEDTPHRRRRGGKTGRACCRKDPTPGSPSIRLEQKSSFKFGRRAS